MREFVEKSGGKNWFSNHALLCLALIVFLAAALRFYALDSLPSLNQDEAVFGYEAFSIAEKFTGKKQQYTYVDENRIGDHICYYSDLRKMKAHYPGWDITQSLEETISQIVEAWKSRTEKA